MHFIRYLNDKLDASLLERLLFSQTLFHFVDKQIHRHFNLINLLRNGKIYSGIPYFADVFIFSMSNLFSQNFQIIEGRKNNNNNSSYNKKVIKCLVCNFVCLKSTISWNQCIKIKIIVKVKLNITIQEHHDGVKVKTKHTTNTNINRV